MELLGTVDRTPAGVKADSPRAWFVVAAAFFASFVVFGVSYSFGVFFRPMAAELGASRTATSALFSITGFANYMLASITGHLSDRFGPRVVIGIGALTMGAGLVLTAFIGHMWVGYFTYGVGVGVGAACAYVPTLALAALIERYGWRTTDIFMGVAAAVLLGACSAVAERPPLAASVAKKHPLGRIVLSSEFVMLYVSWLLATTGLLVPFVFLPSFAHDHGVSQVAAASLVSLIGGVSIVGRLGIGVLADWVGTLRLFQVAVFVMGVSYVIWLALPTFGWLIVFAVILGVGYGARISLMPGVLIEFFGMQNLGGVLGTFFTASGFSAALGPLLTGLIVDYTGRYQWGIAFALVMGLLGFAAIAPLRHRS